MLSLTSFPLSAFRRVIGRHYLPDTYFLSDALIVAGISPIHTYPLPSGRLCRLGAY